MFFSSTTILYNKDTLKQDFIINNVRKPITSISLSPDDRYLATGEVNILVLIRKNNFRIDVVRVVMTLKYVFGT
jgi:hypothetical protein